MKNTITYLISIIILTACGAGSPDLPSSNTTSKVYLCDASIVSITATFQESYFLGLGVPDTTTYVTSGQLHTIIYQFSIAKTRIKFEYNTSGQCKQTVETY